MSEPVGNSPRGDIPGNSHRSREEKPAEEPREVVEKVITGKVITRKPPIWKRLVHSMIAEDAGTVGDLVISDVLVPAIKNMIYDIITQGSARTLFGTTRARAMGGQTAGPVSSLKRAYHDVSKSAESPRALSQESRARHDFDMIVLDTRADAVGVVESLIERVARYGSASVADLYDFVGVTGSFTDRAWGWTSLDDADVRQVRGGFLLDLPRPVSLR